MMNRCVLNSICKYKYTMHKGARAKMHPSDLPAKAWRSAVVNFHACQTSPMGPRYLLEMLSAFQVSEEIWLVLENADGGDLFGCWFASARFEGASAIPQLQVTRIRRVVAFTHPLQTASHARIEGFHVIERLVSAQTFTHLI